MKSSSECFGLVLAGLVIGLFPSSAWADRVSGTLSTTYVIVEDTDLIGDITCTMTGSPCFSFGAPGVELRLNGFTITGRADPVTGCGGTQIANEFGIFTNGMSNVVVRGPGLVQRARADGVFVFGSTNARVENLVVSTTCFSGVRIAASSFGTLVQGVVSVRNGNGGSPCGGI